MASPWYSKADEHPRGEMRLRAGETYAKAFTLTQVDPDTLADIAPKNLAAYINGSGESTLYITFAPTGGSTPTVTTKGDVQQVTIQGDSTEGTVRILVYSTQTQLLWDTQGQLPYDACIWGVDAALDTGSDSDPKDLLWTATAAALPASA